MKPVIDLTIEEKIEDLRMPIGETQVINLKLGSPGPSKIERTITSLTIVIITKITHITAQRTDIYLNPEKIQGTEKIRGTELI